MVRSVEINLGFRQWWETITRHLESHAQCPVGYTYHPSTRKAEAGGFQVWGQSGIHGETLSLKTNNNNNETTNNNSNMEEIPQTYRLTVRHGCFQQIHNTLPQSSKQVNQRRDLISLVYQMTMNGQDVHKSQVKIQFKTQAVHKRCFYSDSCSLSVSSAKAPKPRQRKLVRASQVQRLGFHP